MVRSQLHHIERDERGADKSEEVHENKAFGAQLRAYFRRYMDGDLETVARSRLLREVNDTLTAAGAPPEDQLTQPIWESLCKGDRPPSTAQLDALCHVFTNSRIGFFREQRESFQSAAAPMMKAQQQRREAMKETLIGWRAKNPKGMEDKPSFQELLQQCADNGENMSDLINALKKNWNLNDSQLAAHFHTLSAATPGSKAPTTESIADWRTGTVPIRETLVNLATIIEGKMPETGKQSPIEALLYRINGAGQPYYKQKHGDEAYDAMLTDITAGKANHGQLITALCDASGIPYTRMQELVGIKQLAMWKEGKAHIQDMDKAIAFLELVRPNLTNDNLGERNLTRRMLSAITGRELDIDNIITQSRAAGNPSGAMLSALSGRFGAVTIPTEKFAEAMHAAGHTNISSHVVHRMRNTRNKVRGTAITESIADAMLATIEASFAPLQQRGLLPPLTDEQRATIQETLIGSPHPKTMLKKVIKGEMEISDMVRTTYERRGLNQQGEKGFCGEIGVHHLNTFFTKNGYTDPSSAQAIADWYKKNYKFSKKQQTQVRALCQGIDLSTSPEVILDKVKEGVTPRHEALRQLYDMTGLPRQKMAEAAGVPAALVLYSVTETSGGRIVSNTMPPKELAGHVAALAKIVGLEEQAEEFARQFSSVSRQVALTRRGAEGAGAGPATP